MERHKTGAKSEYQYDDSTDPCLPRAAIVILLPGSLFVKCHPRNQQYGQSVDASSRYCKNWGIGGRFSINELTEQENNDTHRRQAEH